MNIFKVKNKFAALIFLCTFSVGIFSCQTELLEPTPETLFSDLVVFDTPERIELQANALYGFVKAGAFYAGRYIVYGDVRADDFINRTTNGVTGYAVWNHSLTETSVNDVNNLWIAAYAAINQMNVFIAGMEANQAKFVAPIFAADFATTKAPAYVAEARFLRGLVYYSLLQLYARPYADGAGSQPGLPLRLLPEMTSENNGLARSTVAEVYAQIIDDLNFAEANLPATRENNTLRITRAHKNTAIAFKTRVYLSMGDYANVITEANKIVPATAPFVSPVGHPHALAATTASIWATPQESIESILSFPFTTQNAPGVQNQLRFYFTGEYALNDNGILANTTEWRTQDSRRTLVTVSGTERFIGGKYPSGTPFLDKAPVIRYAEVLLNLSEALARTNGLDARAIALLNAVRNRSDAGFTWAPASASELTSAILTERRIEFLGEGLRNNDIMRLLLPIPGKVAVGGVNPTDAAYIWPIPNSELAANPLMTRN